MFTEEQIPCNKLQNKLGCKTKGFSPGEVLTSLLYIGKKGQHTANHVNNTYEKLNACTSTALVERPFFHLLPDNYFDKKVFDGIKINNGC